MRPPRALAVVFASCVMLGCHREAPLVLDPLDYLRVGVDPVAEADVVATGLRRAGYVVTARIAGAGYVALGAFRGTDGATAVRVITSRGTALGVDAPDRSFPTRERALLVDLGRDRDFDGDGRSELAIRIVDPPAFGSCVAIVRILADDTVEEVGVPTLAYGSRVCVDEVADVVGDARVEALVTLRLASLAHEDRLPEVRVPFEGTNGEWRELDPSLAGTFFQAEDGSRAERLAAARATGDLAEVLVVAVERAAIAALEGLPVARQHELLDASIEGVLLSSEASSLVRRAHAAIEAGLVPRPAPRVAPAGEEGDVPQGSSTVGASAPGP